MTDAASKGGRGAPVGGLVMRDGAFASSSAAASSSCRPHSLYHLSVAVLAKLSRGREGSREAVFTVGPSSSHAGGRSRGLLVSEAMKMDVCAEMLRQGNLAQLTNEICALDRFLPLLSVGDRRTDLHRMVQALVDAGDLVHLTLCDQLLSLLGRETTNTSASSVTPSLSNANCELRLLLDVVNLASFLFDAGWHESSCAAYSAVIRRVDALVLEGSSRDLQDNFPAVGDITHLLPLLAIKSEATIKLLASNSSYCQFQAAEDLYHMVVSWITADIPPAILSQLRLANDSILHQLMVRYLSENKRHLALFFSTFSSYLFHLSNYQLSMEWALAAVAALDEQRQSHRVIIEILQQASKACVVRRRFDKAKMLINEAVLRTRDVFGDDHPKYAECLTDLGYYLLNVDQVGKSLKAYETALKIRSSCFGRVNLRVALSHEDLGYASYVKEYNNGRFNVARRHAETALQIMDKLLPERHLMKASSQRVLALILEEIGIDSNDNGDKERLLAWAERLHLEALAVSVKAFGEKNVQTSKHYGNLGRLYQSMSELKKAEHMHLKAIRIKEELLGPDDYEVALSIGHLASLYNYDMQELDKAERLYLRSVDIGLKLFGPGYSGLEYDYRGLIKIYQATDEFEKCQEWGARLRQWRDLRDDALREAQLMEEREMAAEQTAKREAAPAQQQGANRGGGGGPGGAQEGGGIIRNASFYLGSQAGREATPKPIRLLLKDLGDEKQTQDA